MNKIGIIVGEDADLPQGIVKKNKLITFPFIINWKEYKKVINFYKLMRETGGTGPKTSQPSVATFKKVFTEGLLANDEIIMICVSSKFSGTYNAAKQAKKTFKEGAKIHLVDSENSSGAEGLMVLRAIENINQRWGVNKIVDQLRKDIKQINLICTF